MTSTPEDLGEIFKRDTKEALAMLTDGVDLRQDLAESGSNWLPLSGQAPGVQRDDIRLSSRRLWAQLMSPKYID